MAVKEKVEPMIINEPTPNWPTPHQVSNDERRRKRRRKLMASETPAPGPTPVAVDFTFTPTGLSVAFVDATTSITPTTWAWDFDDTQTSTLQNPTNVYLAPGTYNVTMTASDATSSGSVTKPVTVV